MSSSVLLVSSPQSVSNKKQINEGRQFAKLTQFFIRRMHPRFSFPLFVARQEDFSPCDINGGTHFDLCGLGKVGLLSIFQLSAEAELSDALLCY